MKRRGALIAVPVLAAAAVAAAVGLSSGSAPNKPLGGPLAMFQEDTHVVAHPHRTLQTLRSLGVRVLRLNVPWASVAPDSKSPSPPAGFNASDPAAYPAGNWFQFDRVVRQASADGIAVDFLLGGAAPLWANGPGAPPSERALGAWDPSAAGYEQFVQAAATRYSGTYTPPGEFSPLPRVHFWELWSEPNWGPSLQPQLALDPVRIHAASQYRQLVDAAWRALHRSGHGGDTVVIGNLSPRGITVPPNSALAAAVEVSGPLAFTRTLYCVDSGFRPLRGTAAALVGCPTSDSGRARFRRAHPALFDASGYGIHPYPISLPPNQADATNPDTVEFSQIPQLVTVLDRVQEVYGSDKQLPVYNTEYGYITNPPNPGTEYPSPVTAARYLNWAEYLTWRNPRIATTMQFTLFDGGTGKNAVHNVGFTTGLLFSDGTPKATFYAYRMPLFMPTTRAGPNQPLEVWGCVRPARYAYLDTHHAQYVDIQFRTGARGPFRTLKTVRITDVRGYFDVRVKFPARGTVRLRWSYPSDDSSLRDPVTPGQTTIYSRQVYVKVRWWQGIPSGARLSQRFPGTR
jgi:hypothetical protein